MSKFLPGSDDLPYRDDPWTKDQIEIGGREVVDREGCQGWQDITGRVSTNTSEVDRVYGDDDGDD